MEETRQRRRKRRRIAASIPTPFMTRASDAELRRFCQQTGAGVDETQTADDNIANGNGTHDEGDASDDSGSTDDTSDETSDNDDSGNDDELHATRGAVQAAMRAKRVADAARLATTSSASASNIVGTGGSSIDGVGVGDGRVQPVRKAPRRSSGVYNFFTSVGAKYKCQVCHSEYASVRGPSNLWAHLRKHRDKSDDVAALLHKNNQYLNQRERKAKRSRAGTPSVASHFPRAITVAQGKQLRLEVNDLVTDLMMYDGYPFALADNQRFIALMHKASNPTGVLQAIQALVAYRVHA